MLEEAPCIMRLPIENHVTCKICGKEFTSKKCFWRHRKYHKEGQKCQCPICLQWFISQTLLNVHMQNHKDRKTFDCQVCGKTLASKQSFVFHTCSICTKEFHSPGGLERHEKSDPPGYKISLLYLSTRSKSQERTPGPQEKTHG